MNTQIDKLGNEVLDGLEAGMTVLEIAEATGKSTFAVYDRIGHLKECGLVTSPRKGVFEVHRNGNGHRKPDPSPSVGHVNGNGNGRNSHGLPETDRRRVQLPDYMRQREAITLYVEHSPTEVENVLRLELLISGVVLPIPVNRDLRICVGDDIPRWSATQETYNGVTAFRVTYRNGDQLDYSHNPQIPLTVDVK